MNHLKRLSLLTFILSLILLFASIKGDANSFSRNSSFTDASTGSPFESSSSSSRYVLTQALFKSRSFLLTRDQAKFASPDVAEHNGKYFTLFMPGISFMGLPFYILGSIVGLPQLGTFSLNFWLAIINVFLVAALAKRLGASWSWSLLGGFLFLFGSNAWAYALTYSQHHLAVFATISLLLISTHSLTVKNNLLFGIIFGIALLADFPNPIILSPIAVYQLSRHFHFHRNKINWSWLFMGAGVLPFLVIFAYYNLKTTGSPLLSAQFVGRSKEFNVVTSVPAETKSVPEIRSPGLHLPLKSRSLIRGFSILIFSDERGWIYYSPMVLVGIIGLVLTLKKNSSNPVPNLIFAAICFNLLIYAMFGDPWGGWSFGPRYLIPATAMISVFIPVFMQKYGKNVLVMSGFLVACVLSIRLATLAALTTAHVPPKQEAEALPVPIPHTPKLNSNFLAANKSSSLIYNLSFKNQMPANTYYKLVFALALITFVTLTGFAVNSKRV